MHNQDIAAPSSRQSLTAVIIVVVLAGVIITRGGSPEKTQAYPTITLQTQQNIEQSKLSAEDGEVSDKKVYEIHP